MKVLEIKSCELWQGHVEPRELQRKSNTSREEHQRKQEELKTWRQNLGMEKIAALAEKIRDAGIAIQAYSNGNRSFQSDDEIQVISGL